MEDYLSQIADRSGESGETGGLAPFTPAGYESRIPISDPFETTIEEQPEPNSAVTLAKSNNSLNTDLPTPARRSQIEKLADEGSQKLTIETNYIDRYITRSITAATDDPIKTPPLSPEPQYDLSGNKMNVDDKIAGKKGFDMKQSPAPITDLAVRQNNQDIAIKKNEPDYLSGSLEPVSPKTKPVNREIAIKDEYHKQQDMMPQLVPVKQAENSLPVKTNKPEPRLKIGKITVEVVSPAKKQLEAAPARQSSIVNETAPTPANSKFRFGLGQL